MREHDYRAAPPSEPSPARSRLAIGVGVLLIVVLGAGGYLLVNRTSPTPDAAGQGSTSEGSGSAAGEVGLDPEDIVEVIPMDGIPAIDEPRFESVAEVDWLADNEPVIAFELDGEARAYPLQI